jgi:hypothetical protein
MGGYVKGDGWQSREMGGLVMGDGWLSYGRWVA